MKKLLLILPLACASCFATGAEIEMLGRKLSEVQTTVADRTKTDDEVRAKLDEFGQAVDQVAQNMQARGESLVGDLTTVEGWLRIGLAALIGGGAVDMKRTRDRRRRGEAT